MKAWLAQAHEQQGKLQLGDFPLELLRKIVGEIDDLGSMLNLSRALPSLIPAIAPEIRHAVVSKFRPRTVDSLDQFRSVLKTLANERHRTPLTSPQRFDGLHALVQELHVLSDKEKLLAVAEFRRVVEELDACRHFDRMQLRAAAFANFDVPQVKNLDGFQAAMEKIAACQIEGDERSRFPVELQDQLLCALAGSRLLLLPDADREACTVLFQNAVSNLPKPHSDLLRSLTDAARKGFEGLREREVAGLEHILPSLRRGEPLPLALRRLGLSAQNPNHMARNRKAAFQAAAAEAKKGADPARLARHHGIPHMEAKLRDEVADPGGVALTAVQQGAHPDAMCEKYQLSAKARFKLEAAACERGLDGARSGGPIESLADQLGVRDRKLVARLEEAAVGVGSAAWMAAMAHEPLASIAARQQLSAFGVQVLRNAQWAHVLGQLTTHPDPWALASQFGFTDAQSVETLRQQLSWMDPAFRRELGLSRCSTGEEPAQVGNALGIQDAQLKAELEAAHAQFRRSVLAQVQAGTPPERIVQLHAASSPEAIGNIYRSASDWQAVVEAEITHTGRAASSFRYLSVTDPGFMLDQELRLARRIGQLVQLPGAKADALARAAELSHPVAISELESCLVNGVGGWAARHGWSSGQIMSFYGMSDPLGVHAATLEQMQAEGFAFSPEA